MTTFDDREQAFENLFAHDQEVRFRAISRRNKALAGWVAERVNTSGDAAAAYRDDIVMFALDHDGEEPLAQRIATDLQQAGKPLPVAEIRATMDRLLAEAILHEKTG